MSEGADPLLLPSELPEDLRQQILGLIRPWLPERRWFAGKGRTMADCRLQTAQLAVRGNPALLHLVVRVEYAGDAPAELYQVMLGAGRRAPAALPPGSVLGALQEGPHDGLILYEALIDPQLTGRLLSALDFNPVPGAKLPHGLPGRLSTAEQSNSSVVYGDQAVLKFFRKLEPGLNPDLELTLALHRAHCHRVPAPLAWLEAELAAPDRQSTTESTTLALLQEYQAGAEEGWALALRALASEEPPEVPDDYPGDGLPLPFMSDAFALGKATSKVHRALRKALPTERLGRADIEATAEAMARRLDATAEEVPGLRPFRAALHEIFAELAKHRARHVRAQRVHGDLHLGQTLRTAEHGWMLIDFEGEPARPLAERRRLHPVHRDIAGMLRSFDYAAAQALRTTPEPAVRNGAEDRWATVNRGLFCLGYGSAESRGSAACKDTVLLHAYEADKAVYEVGYEARNRPDWLPVPLASLDQLIKRREAPRE